MCFGVGYFIFLFLLDLYQQRYVVDPLFFPISYLFLDKQLYIAYDIYLVAFNLIRLLDYHQKKSSAFSIGLNFLFNHLFFFNKVQFLFQLTFFDGPSFSCPFLVKSFLYDRNLTFKSNDNIFLQHKSRLRSFNVEQVPQQPCLDHFPPQKALVTALSLR